MSKTPRKGGRSSATSTFKSPLGGDSLSRRSTGSPAPTPRPQAGQAEHSKPEHKIKPSELKRYTLQRDNDRPLQFDGTVLAKAKSVGSSSTATYRAAVYRTRGGKYVAEFSTLPTIVDRLPAPEPTPAELAEYRGLFIQAVFTQATRREQKTEDRDLENAHALRDLGQRLSEVSDRDARWLHLWRAERLVVPENERPVVTQRQAEARLELLRGHRARGTAAASLLEALSFLDVMSAALEEAARQDVRPPSGKAAAFDSLEAALAWFRPGKLTNELMNQLGRRDPEFIE